MSITLEEDVLAVLAGPLDQKCHRVCDPRQTLWRGMLDGRADDRPEKGQRRRLLGQVWVLDSADRPGGQHRILGRDQQPAGRFTAENRAGEEAATEGGQHLPWLIHQRLKNPVTQIVIEFGKPRGNVGRPFLQVHKGVRVEPPSHLARHGGTDLIRDGLGIVL